MIYILFYITVFFIGSIPFGLLISRYWLKIDIRNEGSGNIGMTNVMRIGGKWAGIITFLLDFGKGAAAVLIAKIFFLNSDLKLENQYLLINFTGIVAVLGHVYSIFLGFQGGKGISTLFGVLSILHFTIGLTSAMIWVIIYKWKNISSLSGITMLSILPFLFLFVPWIQNEDPIYTIFLIFLMLSLVLIYKHKENIKRLLSGQEAPLNKKK
tara:strand:+ start:850 stop:1482 length:633 start_codon:yes stop_codon:yes gene_type:complete